MNRPISALIFITSLIISPVFAVETFIQEINNLWKTEDYQQLKQKATEQANLQPPNPEAFAVLFSYYTYVEFDHAKALLALNNLLVVLQPTNPSAFDSVTKFKAEFMSFPNESAPPLSPEALQHLHTLFPDSFPANALLLIINSQN